MRRALHGVFWSIVVVLILYTIQAAVLFHWTLKARLPPAPPGDERPAAQVRRELGRNAALHFSPAFWVGRPLPQGVLPLGGLSRRTIVHCNEYGEWLTYPSDEHGFNNRRGAHKKAAAVVIGDSFVEGACVRPGEDLPARLGALNLGIGGVGPLIELAILREYAAPLRPKRVYWLYYASDMPDLQREAADPRLLLYKDQGLRRRQAEVDAAWQGFEALAREKGWAPTAGGPETLPAWRRAARFLGLYYLRAWVRGSYPLSKADQALLGLYVELVLEARRRVEGWGGRFTWVYLPERIAIVNPVRGDRFKDELLKRLRAEGVEVVEVTLDLDAFWLRRSTHYTADGYRRVAEAIQTDAAVDKPAKAASTPRQNEGPATAD